MQFLLEQLLKTFLTLGDVIAGRVFSLMDRQTLSLSLINLTFSRCLFFASWEPVTISHYYIAFYRAPLYVVSDDLSQIADFFFSSPVASTSSHVQHSIHERIKKPQATQEK